jgi:DNA anti-recombination protein RmuC
VAITTDHPQPNVNNTTAQIERRASAGDDAQLGNLDKVRDILFGSQMRDLDRRFAKVEDRLVSETADLKDDLRRRVAAVEQFARSETDTLLQRIKAEHDERSEGTASLSRDLQAASAALDKRISGVDEQLARAHRELRQQILEVHQQLADEMRDKIDALVARLNREADDLRNDKADRVTLAALFTEMAMRLTHESAGSNEQE